MTSAATPAWSFAPTTAGGDYQLLKERGVKFIEEPKELPFGLQAVFSDPDGNIFALAEPRVRPTA